MKKLLLLIFFILSAQKLYPCALCAIYDPTVYVDADVNIIDDRLESVRFRWEFSELFLSQSIIAYDKNSNGKLDTREQTLMFSDFGAALRDLKYHLSLNLDLSVVPIETNSTKESSFSIVGKKLIYDFTVYVGRRLANDHVLQFRFQDESGFFGFFNRENGVRIRSNGAWHIAKDSNFYTSIATLHIVNGEKKLNPVEPSKNSITDGEETQTPWLAKKLYELLLLVRQKLESVQNDGSFSAWTALLLFSFLYGVIHAAGPGHGKSLVGAYFLSMERSFRSAWFYAALIGGVHIVSAFLLTLFAYYLTQAVASKVANESQDVANGIAGTVMVVIALVLIVKKINSGGDSHACDCCLHERTKQGDIWMILSAGAVPCPGTVLVFMSIFTIGAFWAGVLSAFAMSAGVALIIGVSATLGAGLRRGLATKLKHLLRVSELVALVIILLMGVVMLQGILQAINL